MFWNPDIVKLQTLVNTYINEYHQIYYAPANRLAPNLVRLVTWNSQGSYYDFENYPFKITAASHRNQCVKHWDLGSLLVSNCISPYRSYVDTNAITGLILGLRPANERRCYFVTTSLIGWAQTLNQPCIILNWCMNASIGDGPKSIAVPVHVQVRVHVFPDQPVVITVTS